MDITTGFLIYATLFRLTVIAVGAASIFLGYLLFVKDPIGQGKTSAVAEAGGFKLTLRNFWPGAYFALFGTVIIGIMLWQGNPELVVKELAETKGVQGNGASTVSRQTEIRGGETHKDVSQYWNKLSDPNLSLDQAAKPINGIARIWREANRTGEALAFARFAAQIKPDNADYLALLAELFQDNEEHDKALQAMQAAATLDNSYQDALHMLQDTVKKKE